MQKRTREIIALVLLIVLGIGGISAMAWYMLVGHNWNAAATNIDDRIGNMDGYMVVLCEGPAVSSQQRLANGIVQTPSAGRSTQAGDASGSKPEKAISLGDALDSYQSKGAQVVTIDCGDLSLYADPVMVSRGGRRVSVFLAQGPFADIAASALVKLSKRYAIDFTICITDSARAVERGFESVDMVICTDARFRGKEGEHIGGAYVIGMPRRGHVGAVIVAPSGFLSSKMLNVV